MRLYRYTVEGTAAAGQTWEVEGDIEIATGEFARCATLVMREAFGKLTQGKAVYGRPGVGCKGPYGIKRFLIMEKRNDQ